MVGRRDILREQSSGAAVINRKFTIHVHYASIIMLRFVCCAPGIVFKLVGIENARLIV